MLWGGEKHEVGQLVPPQIPPTKRIVTVPWSRKGKNEGFVSVRIKDSDARQAFLNLQPLFLSNCWVAALNLQPKYFPKPIIIAVMQAVKIVTRNSKDSWKLPCLNFTCFLMYEWALWGTTYLIRMSVFCSVKHKCLWVMSCFLTWGWWTTSLMWACAGCSPACTRAICAFSTWLKEESQNKYRIYFTYSGSLHSWT